MQLDMHAHIDPGIAPSELDRLGACVVAVTRSLAEYADVTRRHDRSVVWAMGCHPGLAQAVRSFSLDAFRAALSSTLVIGEVGLDGSAKVPLATQQAVFDDVMSALVETPRIVSVHSYRATSQVLNTIKRYRPKGVILHWWLGDEVETQAALDLGAYFSVNAAQVKKWRALKLVPKERLLFETDHPFGDRGGPEPRRPGNLSSVESRVADLLGISVEVVRQQTWRNLHRLSAELEILDMLPRQFQVQMLAS
jgi:TatD DNase family protein